MDTLKQLNLLSVSLPIGSHETCQILAGHHSPNGVGLWIILSSDSSRKLVYCTPSHSDSYFVLPYNFLYLGSSSNGQLFFLADGTESAAPILYVISYQPNSGIAVTKTDLHLDHDQWARLFEICQSHKPGSTDSTLHDSPLLHDNVLNESTYPSLFVPYHSLRDVLLVKAVLQQGAFELTSKPALLTAIKTVRAMYPNLTVVDAVEIGSDVVAVVANDSSIRTLSCGVESRLFICNGSPTPSLVLGRPIFSIDNRLSISPESSNLIYPSLGLVLASPSSISTTPPKEAASSFNVYSINYTTSTLYFSADFGSTFTLSGSMVHHNSDLVTTLIHHLDDSQTLIFSSRLDRSEVYFIDF